MSEERSRNNFDVIIIGAGSIGVPSAYFLAKGGFKVLVIESMPSVGQASNKHAIGGIRATHSDLAKIHLGKRSLEIFSNWEKQHGDDIEWYKGGYSFLAYDAENERVLKELTEWQSLHALNISWLDKQELLAIIPNLKQENLIGGTYSPDDGSASPLKAAFSFYQRSKDYQAMYRFNESVIAFKANGNKVIGVKTDKGEYYSNWVINAAGGWADTLSAKLGVHVPVIPDSHEAAITEPVARLFHPMFVDMRPFPGSANFYFYQHPTGKIIFCMTPEPTIPGIHTITSGGFLPKAARRLIEILPVLKHIRVRRVWRGVYPMTPDGSPIIGEVAGLDGYILAVGMCGQGFMFGPGVGKLLTQMLLGQLDESDIMALNRLSYQREFKSIEMLK